MAESSARSWRNAPRDQGSGLVFTCDPNAYTEFWIYDYGPEFVEIERRRYGSVDVITAALGGRCQALPIPVARDCADGFQVAFYARPEAFLDSRVRGSQSAWRFLPPGAEERIVASLARDLGSGEWDRRYGHLRVQPFINNQLRLIVAHG